MLKQHTLACLLLLIACIAHGQTVPINDNCTGAVELTIGSTCTPTLGTLRGSTSSAPPFRDAASCNQTYAQRIDVWYTFQTDTNTSVALDVQADTILYFTAQLFSGTCTSPTFENCAVASVPVTRPQLQTTFGGLQRNTRYYIRICGGQVLANLYGGFSICLRTPTAVAPRRVVSTTTGGPFTEGTTWVGGAAPTVVDTAVIEDGATVWADYYNLRVARLDVGQGQAGQAQFMLVHPPAIEAKNFYVSGDVRVYERDSIQIGDVPRGGLTEKLWIGGDLRLDGGIAAVDPEQSAEWLVFADSSGTRRQRAYGSGHFRFGRLTSVECRNPLGLDYELPDLQLCQALSLVRGSIATQGRALISTYGKVYFGMPRDSIGQPRGRATLRIGNGSLAAPIVGAFGYELDYTQVPPMADSARTYGLAPTAFADTGCRYLTVEKTMGATLRVPAGHHLPGMFLRSGIVRYLGQDTLSIRYLDASNADTGLFVCAPMVTIHQPYSVQRYLPLCNPAGLAQRKMRLLGYQLSTRDGAAGGRPITFALFDAIPSGQAPAGTQLMGSQIVSVAPGPGAALQDAVTFTYFYYDRDGILNAPADMRLVWAPSPVGPWQLAGAQSPLGLSGNTLPARGGCQGTVPLAGPVFLAIATIGAISDLSVTAIGLPAKGYAGCGGGATADVAVTQGRSVRISLTNNGGLPINSATVYAQAGSSQIATQTVNYASGLYPHTTASVDIPLDIAGNASIQIRAWIGARGAEPRGNDTLIAGLDVTPKALPVSELFDTCRISQNDIHVRGWGGVAGFWQASASGLPRQAEDLGPFPFKILEIGQGSVLSTQVTGTLATYPFGPITDSTRVGMRVGLASFVGSVSRLAAGDSLVLEASADCGGSWRRLYKMDSLSWPLPLGRRDTAWIRVSKKLGLPAGSHAVIRLRSARISRNYTSMLFDDLTIQDTLTTPTRPATTSSNGALAIWPNPSRGLVQITLPGSKTAKTIEIIDARGAVWPAQLMGDAVDCSALPAGLYLVRARTTCGATYQGRLVRE